VYVVNVTGTLLKNSRKKLFASPRHGRRISRTQVAKEDEGKPITDQIWTFGSFIQDWRTTDLTNSTRAAPGW